MSRHRATIARITIHHQGSPLSEVCTLRVFLVVSFSVLCADTTGKYIRDGVEVKSSEESLDEEKQKKLWEMTGGYAHLDGFAPLEVPPPPAEPAPEEPKTEPKAEEANGEAAKETGDTPIITDSNKAEEIKTEEKAAGMFDTHCLLTYFVMSVPPLPKLRRKELLSVLSCTCNVHFVGLLCRFNSRRASRP